MNKILDKIADLIDVKSIVTLSMTGVMIAMLVGSFNPQKEFAVLFSTSYGCVITYFFTKKPSDKVEPETIERETVIVKDSADEYID